ncbi:MAG: RluA family pseudouridine synthase [Breznakia sp.]
MDKQQFKVDVKASRLDKYVSEAMQISRTRAQGLLEDACILVNGNIGKANMKLQIGDVVDVNIPTEKPLALEAQDIPLEILYEDQDVVVVNKPKGMLTHPTAHTFHHTLVNALLFHIKDLSGIGGVIRPGIVHRIDKDTSGLLIVAKNDQSHIHLSKQLEKKSVSRKYYALVHGVMEHDYGTIDAPIARSHKDRMKMGVCDKNAKPAITHFKVVERFSHMTLMECSLETGRTHQIRVHMEYIGYPLVGDTLYNTQKTLATNGQMLHAYELRFIHPRNEKEVIVQAPLPAWFEEVLNTCRKDVR